MMNQTEVTAENPMLPESIEDNMRAHERHLVNAEVLVKIKSTPWAKSLHGRTFRFSTEDISENGMQVQVGRNLLPEGSEVEVVVMLYNGRYRCYWHEGSVVRTVPHLRGASDDCSVGIQIEPTNDMQTWKKTVKEISRFLTI